MANYFVDSTTGDNGDDGTTMDLAFATIEYAMESGGPVGGDIIWVRRGHSEIPTSDISPGADANEATPIRIVGWPRAANTSITSATWTNGSRTVDLIVGLSMDKSKHQARYVTGPDGETYMICRVVDSNTVKLLNEYAGASVSGVSGACTIQADEDWVDDMGTAFGFDDSGWTIQESDWDADAETLALIDYNSTAYNVTLSTDMAYDFCNLEFKNTTDANGPLYILRAKWAGVRGCIFTATTNAKVGPLCQNEFVAMERCTIEGNSTGAAQSGLTLQLATGYVKNVTIDNLGGYGVVLQSNIPKFLNVAIGREEPCDYHAFYAAYEVALKGRDVYVDDTNGQVYWYYGSGGAYIAIENYNQTLGSHKMFTPSGEVTGTAVVGGSGDPYKRSGGSDKVIEILYDRNNTTHDYSEPIVRGAQSIFEHEFEATTSSKSYRYYVQSVGALTATQLWLEVEYVSAYDDNSEYVIKEEVSDETISARTGADDWGQYIEVTGITPAVGSKVRIRCYCSYYHATNKIYIDPKVVITDG
jgi:hypothetical protein